MNKNRVFILIVNGVKHKIMKVTFTNKDNIENLKVHHYLVNIWQHFQMCCFGILLFLILVLVFFTDYKTFKQMLIFFFAFLLHHQFYLIFSL